MTPSELHRHLIERVRSRLDAAVTAQPGPWRWQTIGAHRHEQQVLISGLVGAHVIHEAIPDVWPQAHDAVFIENNDPDRIIRDCQRDLRVLDRHRYKRYALSPEDDDQAGYCAACVFGDYPCDEVLDLAMEYEINPGESG